VAKGGGDHGEKGYLYDVALGLFRGNRACDPPLTDASLRQLARLQGGELTYTCAPPGSGVRLGLDRDENGILDGDEEDAGGDCVFLSKPATHSDVKAATHSGVKAATRSEAKAATVPT
jgi:hypothetical protein